MRLSTFLLLTMAAVQSIVASPLNLVISQDLFNLHPGDSSIVTGRIQNQTGTALSSDELFVNGFGYDPDALFIEQLVGLVPFFLGDGNTSSEVDLFRLTVSPAAPGRMTFDLGIDLSTLSGLNSDPIFLTVSTVPITSVPEPATWMLTLPPLCWMLRKRKAAVFAICALLAASAMFAQAPSYARFAVREATVTASGASLDISLRIENSGNAIAENLLISSASFGANAADTASLPIRLGNIEPSGSLRTRLLVPGRGLAPGSTQLLRVGGTYQLGGRTLGFISNFSASIPNPGGTVPMTPQARTLSLNAINTWYRANLGPVPSSINARLVTYLRSRPEISSATTTPDGNVSARWQDGALLVFFHNKPVDDEAIPDPVARAATSASAPPASQSPAASQQIAAAPPNPFVGIPSDRFLSIPKSTRARLFFPLAFPYNLTPYVEAWLKSAGYSDTQVLRGTLEELAAIGGEGVFYLATHGGMCDLNLYCVASGTERTEAGDTRYAGDIVTGNADSLKVAYSLHPEVDKVLYTITKNWISAHWRPFSDNSFVHLSVCGSQPVNEAAPANPVDLPVREFRQAFFDKNASVYSGWNGNVRQGVAYLTTLLMFDRMLGTNALQGAMKHVPNERPFPLREVLDDFPKHDRVGFDVKNAAHMAVTLNPIQRGSGFGILAPSIYRMHPFEASPVIPALLTISGFFGDKPSDPARQPIVRIGGVPLTPSTWNSESINVHLPQADPPLAGEVTVEFGSTLSNRAMLSSWVGTFTSRRTDIGTVSTWKAMNLKFRHDIRKARPHIHDAPQEPRNNLIQAAKGSTINFVAEGEGSCGDPTDPTGSRNIFHLSGGGSLPPLDYVTSPWYVEGLMPDSRHLTLQFHDGIRVMPAQFTYTFTNPPNPSRVEVFSNFLLPMPFSQPPGVSITLDASGHILSGRSTAVESVTYAVCNFTAREQIVWPAIRNRYVPDPNSAR